MSHEPTLGEILARHLASAPVDPIVSAANGDTESQRQLARHHYQNACVSSGLASLLQLVEALTFARLASTPEHKLEDLSLVVFLYGQIAAECRTLGAFDEADEREARGFLLAELMAQEGDEKMAELVVQASQQVTPEAHRKAHALREKLQ